MQHFKTVCLVYFIEKDYRIEWLKIGEKLSIRDVPIFCEKRKQVFDILPVKLFKVPQHNTDMKNFLKTSY